MGTFQCFKFHLKFDNGETLIETEYGYSISHAKARLLAKYDDLQTINITYLYVID